MSPDDPVLAPIQRRLASIMFSDMVGYSALAQRDEVLAVKLLDEHRKILRAQFAGFNGREMDAVGDGFFVEFSSAVDAANCAAAIQKSLLERNGAHPPERRIQVRIGLHLGDVIVEGGRVLGDGVNIAARIQSLAQPGEVLLSEDVARQIRNKVPIELERMGPRPLKNISAPIVVFRMRLPWSARTAAGTPRNRISWGVLAGVVLIIAIAATAYFRYVADTQSPRIVQGTDQGQLETVAKLRLAVLPFANLSDDPSNEYFVDGMTEELISRLSRIGDIDVIARTSIMQYKGTAVSIDTVGKELNVTTVLEGSVRRSGNRLRITAQLIDAGTQAHLWAEDYDREAKDVFAIQSDVALRVAEALRLRLLPAQKTTIERRGTQDLKAYEAHLHGLYQLNAATPDGFEKSIEHFKQAIALDPLYAQPHAGISNALELMGVFGLRPQSPTFAQAKEAALKALELDDSVVEAWITLGAVKVYLDLDWRGADQAFKKALALNPRSTVAHDWYSINYLCPKGLHEEATAQIRRALELDPQSPNLYHDAGWVFWCASKYSDAIGYFKNAVDRQPNLSFAYDGLALSYSALERHDEAIAAALQQVALTSGADFPLGTLGFVYAQAGRMAEAQAMLGRLTRGRALAQIEPIALALLQSALNETDEAFALLDRSFEARSFQRLIYINGGNYFSPLRGDPRFAAMVRKLGLVS